MLSSCLASLSLSHFTVGCGDLVLFHGHPPYSNSIVTECAAVVAAFIHT